MSELFEIAKSFEPKFEYSFSIALSLVGLKWAAQKESGQARGAIYVADGTVEGPEISGTVIPMSGGDWPIKREDGVLDFDARYLLELDDGSIVYMTNRGYRWANSEEIARKMSNHEYVEPSEYYMRVTPKFEVTSEKYSWMEKYVFVGVAEKTPGANRIHYYKIL